MCPVEIGLFCNCRREKSTKGSDLYNLGATLKPKEKSYIHYSMDVCS